MRIALVVPGLTQGGGVPAVAHFLLHAVALGGHEAKLVSLCMDGNDPDSVRLRAPASLLRGVRARTGEWEGRAFVQVGCWGSELEFQRYRPRRLLAEAVADCDVIQVVCGSPAWANAVLDLGKPVALQVATRAKVERRGGGVKARGLAGLWRAWMTRITDRLDDRALRRVDAVQVENPWMLDYARSVAAGLSVDVRYAPPGVDETVFHPVAERLQGPRYLLCVGRLGDSRKKVDLLLEAFARLPAAAGTPDLVLAGASGPSPAFWARAEALGVRDRVRFAQRPSRAELVSLYQHATVFALPSDEEGLGVVVLEAMACGVPVVSTRSGGPDGIITDGEDGFLTPLDDAEALADRLGRLFLSDAENARMGRNARATIEARYAKDVAARAFVGVWERLAAPPPEHAVR